MCAGGPLDASEMSVRAKAVSIVFMFVLVAVASAHKHSIGAWFRSDDWWHVEHVDPDERHFTTTSAPSVLVNTTDTNDGHESYYRMRIQSVMEVRGYDADRHVISYISMEGGTWYGHRRGDAVEWTGLHRFDRQGVATTFVMHATLGVQDYTGSRKVVLSATVKNWIYSERGSRIEVRMALEVTGHGLQPVSPTDVQLNTLGSTVDFVPTHFPHPVEGFRTVVATTPERASYEFITVPAPNIHCTLSATHTVPA